MIDIKKKVSDFHTKAQRGIFPECKECPRNPLENKTTYANTCLEHFGISKNGLLIIMRDPGGASGGAARTNKLCPYCNNDKSAIKFRRLLNLIKIQHSYIYFCNAVLHGFYGKNIKPSEIELNCCKGVITNLFEILSPKIIFALGKEALESSYEILSNGKNVKASMNTWIEKEFYFGAFNSTYLFSIPHISFIDTNLGRYELSTDEVFSKISNDINAIF